MESFKKEIIGIQRLLEEGKNVEVKRKLKILSEKELKDEEFIELVNIKADINNFYGRLPTELIIPQEDIERSLVILTQVKIEDRRIKEANITLYKALALSAESNFSKICVDLPTILKKINPNLIPQKIVASLYDCLGQAYRHEGYFLLALINHYKAICIIKKTMPILYTEFHFNTAIVYKEMGGEENYILALEYFDLALSKITNNSQTNHLLKLAIYDSKGLIYRELMEDPNNAIKEHQKAWSILQNDKKQTLFLAKVYSNLAQAYFENKEEEKAFNLLEKSLVIRKKLTNYSGLEYQYIVSDGIHLIANHFLKTEEYHLALPQINDAIENINLTNESSRKVKDFRFLLSKTQILRGLICIHKDNSLSKEAFRTIEDGIQFVDKLRNNLTEKDIISLSKNVKPFLDSAMEILGYLYNQNKSPKYATTMFSIAEKSKAFALYQSIIRAEQAQRTGVFNFDEQTIEEELSLIREEIHTNDDTKSALERINKIEQSYEHFFFTPDSEKSENQHRKINTLIDVKDFQQENLSLQSIVVSYYTTQETITIFTIDSNSFEIHTINIDKTFFENITDLLDILLPERTPNPIHKDDFVTKAFELYQVLLAPIKKRISNKTHLFIIPDAALSTFPFELLLDQQSSIDLNYWELPYLIKKYSITYNYSVTLLDHINKRFVPQKISTQNFVSFGMTYEKTAPIKFNKDSFGPLKYSKEEIKAIWNLLPSTSKQMSFFDEEATKANFISSSKDSKYIHIAAHAFRSKKHTELSGILLQSKTRDSKTGILFISEIYRLQLIANLLVLSCCDTGSGKMIDGEGILAISRGFIYAGVSNVIHTLLKVPDKSSYQLNVRFYAELMKGLSYSEALRNAKLSMLTNPSYLPKDWSIFVLLGNN